ncbi:50S ribosomal protein L11 methyltransferase [Lewinellaceae bacterium SD302]|nr:50S ribosomal protein L11 methyltransferase [Lewinellaceae bacterium SD302]
MPQFTPSYNKYTIESATDHDILIAFLAEENFDSFSEGETDNQLITYRLAEEHEAALAYLGELNERFPLTYRWELMPDKNWNEEWEKQFEPIYVKNRLGIRASFHPPMEDVREELIIDPKMAFGTGHHATTWMVSDLMFDQEFENRIVLDFGCGTGVLALLAKRLGAGFTWAVDIEKPSYENTLENAITNNVSLDVVTHGTLDDVAIDKNFDMILANINRNVILASLPALHERLNDGGLLFVSGILAQDAELVEQSARQAGFSPAEHREREGWQAWVFRK